MFLFTEVVTLVEVRDTVKLLDGFPYLGIGRQEIFDVLQTKFLRSDISRTVKKLLWKHILMQNLEKCKTYSIWSILDISPSNCGPTLTVMVWLLISSSSLRSLFLKISLQLFSRFRVPSWPRHSSPVEDLGESLEDSIFISYSPPWWLYNRQQSVIKTQHRLRLNGDCTECYQDSRHSSVTATPIS